MITTHVYLPVIEKGTQDGPPPLWTEQDKSEDISQMKISSLRENKKTFSFLVWPVVYKSPSDPVMVLHGLCVFPMVNEMSRVPTKCILETPFVMYTTRSDSVRNEGSLNELRKEVWRYWRLLTFENFLTNLEQLPWNLAKSLPIQLAHPHRCTSFHGNFDSRTASSTQLRSSWRPQWLLSSWLLLLDLANSVCPFAETYSSTPCIPFEWYRQCPRENFLQNVSTVLELKSRLRIE